MKGYFVWTRLQGSDEDPCDDDVRRFLNDEPCDERYEVDGGDIFWCSEEGGDTFEAALRFALAETADDFIIVKNNGDSLRVRFNHSLNYKNGQNVSEWDLASYVDEYISI